MTAVNLKQWAFYRSMSDDELIAYARTSTPEEAHEISEVMIERFTPKEQSFQPEKDIQHA